MSSNAIILKIRAILFETQIYQYSPNLAELGAGAYAVDAPDNDWFRLLDGVPNSPGIQSNRNPYVLTIALSGNAQIDTFVFKGSPQNRVTPRHATAEVSTQGSNGPWTKAYDADLSRDGDNDSSQVVRAALPQPVEAKWLRLTLVSPPGDAPYGIGLAQFEARGKLAQTDAPPAVRQVAGLYHFPLNFGANGYVLLKQQGAGVEGCYFEAARQPGSEIRVGQVLGTLTGGIEDGGYLRLTRTAQGEKTGTPGFMAFSPDSHEVFSAMFNGAEHSFNQVEESPGTRIGDSTLTCDANASGASDPALSQLEQTGRLPLYGVNFDFDQHTLRADAQPVLDRLATLLKAHPAWRIEVAGHTDASGTESHNLALSQNRAAAVASYLVAKGVAHNELNAKGYGATRPVMPNDTETGRAQNRRVELVMQ